MVQDRDEEVLIKFKGSRKLVKDIRHTIITFIIFIFWLVYICVLIELLPLAILKIQLSFRSE